MTLNLIQKIRKQLKAVKSKVRKRVSKKTIGVVKNFAERRKEQGKLQREKVKRKYNKDGSLKKIVRRRGGKRTVVKTKNIKPTRTTVREKRYTTERRRKKYK